jgi:hypothetical protein
VIVVERTIMEAETVTVFHIQIQIYVYHHIRLTWIVQRFLTRTFELQAPIHIGLMETMMVLVAIQQMEEELRLLITVTECHPMTVTEIAIPLIRMCVLSLLHLT